MAFRKKLSRRGSRSLFTATALKTHKKNLLTGISRGGIRM